MSGCNTSVVTKEALQISSSECSLSELAKMPFWILDAYVLPANVKTGVYRTCDEIFKRLVTSEEVETCLIVTVTFRKDVTPGLPLWRPASTLTPGPVRSLPVAC